MKERWPAGGRNKAIVDAGVDSDGMTIRKLHDGYGFEPRKPELADKYLVSVVADRRVPVAPVTGPAPSSWRAVADAEPWLPPVHAGLQPKQIHACPMHVKVLLAKLTQLTNELNQDMVYAKQTIGTLMSIQIAQQQSHAAAEHG